MIPGVSPCGLAVSSIRSCYDTVMRFDPNSDVETPVSWYFVPEDTPYIPYMTPFRSWNNVPEWLKGSDHLGEVLGAPRTWRDGSEPIPTRNELPPCGTADQWYNGVVMPPVPPTPVNVYGGPACCPLPDSPFLHLGCVNCPGGAWDVYTLVVGGIAPTDPLFGAQGQWAVTYDGSCEWLGPFMTLPNSGGIPPLYRWEVTVRPNGVLVSLEHFATDVNLFGTVLPWDCLSPVVVPRTAFGPPWSPPPSVQLFPGPPPGPLVTGCANILGLTNTAYFAEVDAYGIAGPLDRLAPAWYVLEQTSPCVWQGEAVLLRGRTANPALVVPLVLEVLPGGMVSLAVGQNGTLETPVPIVYTSLPGWDGTGPLALLAAATSEGLLNGPAMIRLQLPP